MRCFYFNFFKSKFRRNSIFGILPILLLLFSAGRMTGQANLYTFSQSNGTFSAVTAGTVLGTATANTSAGSLNSVVYPITLPFAFTFNGNIFNSANVSSNGFMTFGSTAPTTTLTTPISGTNNFDGVISAFGRDINAVFNINNITGDIRWETTGVAPNRKAVVQWSNFRPTYSIDANNAYVFSFQIILEETTNKISVVYNSGSTILGTVSTSSTVQIGLRGATNSDFNNRKSLSTTLFSSSSAGVANNDSQYYSTSSATSGMPPAGLTYTWTPATCYPPSNLSVNTITPNGANLQWTAPSNVPGSGYDIFYSTNNSAPTSATVPSLTVSSLSTPITSLLPSTVYYVWVRSKCSSTDFSVWTNAVMFTTLCQPPSLLSTNAGTTCSNNSATLSATADTGATINWYDSATGSSPVGTGSTFTTPALTTTTNYWASASTGANSYVGPASPSVLSNSGSATLASSYYVTFVVSNTAMYLISLDVFPLAANQNSSLEIYQGTANTNLLYSIPFSTTIASGGTVAQTIPVNVFLLPGTYNIRMSGSGSYYRNYSGTAPGGGAVFPYNTTNFSITGSANSTNNAYYFMYNFYVGNMCESPRQQVTATVDTCLATSEVNLKDNLKIHPNPVNDILNIDNFDKVKSLSVVDVSGRVVYSEAKTSGKIDLSNLKGGMYLLNLELKDGSKVSHKIIKK